jgi:hypothetical protein
MRSKDKNRVAAPSLPHTFHPSLKSSSTCFCRITKGVPRLEGLLCAHVPQVFHSFGDTILSMPGLKRLGTSKSVVWLWRWQSFLPLSVVYMLVGPSSPGAYLISFHRQLLTVLKAMSFAASLIVEYIVQFLTNGGVLFHGDVQYLVESMFGHDPAWLFKRIHRTLRRA